MERVPEEQAVPLLARRPLGVMIQAAKVGYTCIDFYLLRAAPELRTSCIRILRYVFCFFAVLSPLAQASAQTSTTTSISISTQQAAGTTVATIVATVKAGSSAVTGGTVDFFDGTKPIGTAQLVQSAAAGFTPGTATLRKLLGPGTHSISADFRQIKAYAASASGPQPVSVAGTITNTATLYQTASFPVSDVLTKLTVADINGDGFPDIILPLLDQTDAVAIYLNDPANPGHFSLNQTLQLIGFESVQAIVVDVDGDGLLDIVLSSDDITNPGDSDKSAGLAAIFLQDSAHPGTFKPGTYVRSTFVTAESMSVADMDGDGLLDIVFTGNYYDIDEGIYGNGVEIAYQSATTRATFSLAPHSFVDYESSFTANVADMDGDGNPDVVFGGISTGPPGGATGSVEIFYLDPAHLNTFPPVADFPSAPMAYASTVYDVDGDGHPDLLLGGETNGLQFLRNDPKNPGKLLAPVASPVFNSSVGLSLADVDGDGILDVVNANDANAFSVLKGNGTGSFGPGVVYGVSSPAGEVEQVGTADFDGDGLDDVVVTSRFSHGSAVPTYQVNIFTHSPVAGKVIPGFSLTASSTPVSLGSPVVFTATLASGSGVPTGTVTFTTDTGTLGSALVTPSGTATFSTTSVPAGSRTIVAHYSGDANFVALDSMPVFVFILGATPTLSLTANPVAAPAGTTFTFTATVSGTGPVPAGTVRFSNFVNGSGITLADVTLDSSGKATYSTGQFTRGPYEIYAFYMGDATYGQATTFVNITVQAGASIVLTSTAPTSTQPVTFTATVTGLPSVASLPISFFDYTALAYTTTTDANGIATWVASGLLPGTHGVTAQYLPVNTGGSALSNEVFYILSPTSTTLTLSSSPANPLTGQALTLTAVVKASTGTAIPSGSVSFSEDSNPLGTVTLDATGTATMVTSPQASGSHSISATYAASPVFSNSMNTFTFTVPVPDFALALDKTSLTLSAGTSGTVNVSLTSANGFSDVVNLSCPNAPATVSCSFSNPSPSVGTAPVQVVLTVHTTTTQVRNAPSGIAKAEVIVAFLALPWLFFGRRRSGRLAACFLFLISFACTAFTIAGCSSSSGASSSPAPPPAPVTFQVTGKAQSSSTVRSTNFTINFQ